MCDPLSLALLAAGTAASVGGGIVAGREANQSATNVAKARNRELERILSLNDQNTQEARSLFDTRVADINANSGAGLMDDQANRMEGIQGNIDTSAPLPIEISENAPKVVQGELAKSIADAKGRAAAQGAAQGRLGGYGDFFRRQAMDTQETGRNVDTSLDAIRGRMRLLPSFMDYEEIKATKPQSGLGEILKVVGSGLGMAAGTRGLSAKPGGSGSYGSYYNDYGG